MKCKLCRCTLLRQPHVLKADRPMWQAIAIAPVDRDVEVAVIDRDGEHPIVVPCRRTADGWIDALSRRRLDIRPTHWRPWRVPVAASC
jgi:hypothetical protein